MLKSTTRCRKDEEEDSLFMVKRQRISYDVKGVIEQQISIFMEERRRISYDVKGVIERRLNDDEVKLLEQDLEDLVDEQEMSMNHDLPSVEQDLEDLVDEQEMSMNHNPPSDLWFEILRRIPAAHLFPLKAVCKTFHRMISNDFFGRLPQLKDLLTTTSAFIISTDPKAATLSYDPEKSRFDVSRFDYYCGSNYHDIDNDPPIILRHRPMIIDSYHGLLLVRILDRLLLCNPITRSYIQFLPSTCGFSQENFGYWKIGYDDVSEKYKVFGLRLRRNKVSVYVFDVEDGRCQLPRLITTTAHVVGSDQIIVYDVIKESVLVNGNVCWLIITKKSKEETQWQTCIVSACVTTEEVNTRNCSHLPVNFDVAYDTLFAANGTFYIGKNGQLFIFLAIWILEGFENPQPTWRMKHWIDDSRISRIADSKFGHIRALGLFRDKVLIMTMQGLGCYQLCMYDLISGHCNKVTLPREVESDHVKWGIYIKRKRRSFGPFRIVA